CGLFCYSSYPGVFITFSKNQKDILAGNQGLGFCYFMLDNSGTDNSSYNGYQSLIYAHDF
ncbi:MAG TPA: hypothetical protein PLW19_04800, partial [Anaerolineaceae bacterium]|nr:hypothetical protein [Anaerolineaceae bacterium]